jgi:transglutaminase-like putative cysteine protease
MVAVLAEPLADLDRKLVFIRAFLREGCADPDMQRLAQGILAQAGPALVTRRDPWTVAMALFGWVKRTIPFARDPATGEIADLAGMQVQGPLDLVQNPAATLARGVGDCVALTVLLGSLVCAAGLPIRLGLQDTRGLGVDHVLLLVGLPQEAPQEWLPLDLTAGEPGALRPGREQVLAVSV